MQSPMFFFFVVDGSNVNAMTLPSDNNIFPSDINLFLIFFFFMVFGFLYIVERISNPDETTYKECVFRVYRVRTYLRRVWVLDRGGYEIPR